MAFNFNWSPLTADASFYTRAQELLTTALNKSPKPPIIVDDILVNELNLGSVPPDLEILEIGDLAEDRFRGIFKMCYAGDAFLTLKTRVQVCLLSSGRQYRFRICALLTFISSGKPAQYLFVDQALLCLSTTSSCSLWPNHTATNHSVRHQTLRIHHPGLFETKRVDTGVPQRSSGITQGLIYI